MINLKSYMRLWRNLKNKNNLFIAPNKCDFLTKKIINK